MHILLLSCVLTIFIDYILTSSFMIINDFFMSTLCVSNDFLHLVLFGFLNGYYLPFSLHDFFLFCCLVSSCKWSYELRHKSLFQYKVSVFDIDFRSKTCFIVNSNN